METCYILLGARRTARPFFRYPLGSLSAIFPRHRAHGGRSLRTLSSATGTAYWVSQTLQGCVIPDCLLP